MVFCYRRTQAHDNFHATRATALYHTIPEDTAASAVVTHDTAHRSVSRALTASLGRGACRPDGACVAVNLLKRGRQWGSGFERGRLALPAGPVHAVCLCATFVIAFVALFVHRRQRACWRRPKTFFYPIGTLLVLLHASCRRALPGTWHCDLLYFTLLCLLKILPLPVGAYR